jgi:non-specific serine/threonine protein kinase
MSEKKLPHFYIAQEQSIYLLSHEDATKLKQWVLLCQEQLKQLGYQNISLLGKGAYGFVFSASNVDKKEVVFKFSRVNLPQHVQDRLEEEAHIQGQLAHPKIPQVIEYHRIKRQSILQMTRAPGVDLEKYSHLKGALPPELIVKIAIQLTELLLFLRDKESHLVKMPYVHGDIKPSNIMFDENTGLVQLIDWGSSVKAQLDISGQSTSQNILDLMSSDLQHTNARLGDVYFIGPEQLAGNLSSPRFDEQGLAATLYALASGQSCRFGTKIIPPNSLGLPKLLADILTGMLSDDIKQRNKAGDYLFNNLHYLRRIVLADKPSLILYNSLLPISIKDQATMHNDIETVVYGSRKSFLREESNETNWHGIDDAQLEKYYKNFLMGMGDNEKAFIAALGRLGNFPVVGGLAIRWAKEGVYIDSNITLFDDTLKSSFENALNNMIYLAQGIDRIGVFKSCLFDARNTLHVERVDESKPFVADEDQVLSFEISDVTEINESYRLHSYFEDGKDPDEYLHLPDALMNVLAKLNLIHHTGCIIFEVLPNHLKIHSYLMLFEHDKQEEFKTLLAEVMSLLPVIKGLGISGFMKFPYKDTRFFEHQATRAEKLYPKNPKKA